MSSKVVSCNGCNVVICELLAFMQNKVEIMKDDSIINLCATAFSEEDVLLAKNLLYDSVKSADRNIIVRRKEKVQKNLQDMVSLLRKVHPDDIPIFVAQDLHKLPPVTFDHIDCTRLLKNIITLQSDVDMIREKYATKSECDVLKREILNLKEASLVNNFECSKFVNTRRGGSGKGTLFNYGQNSQDSGPFGIMEIENKEKQSQFEKPASLEPLEANGSVKQQRLCPSLSHVYHRKNHKSEKKFICDICSKTFNAPCKLQRHIVSHRADKFVLRYECPVCAHMFNTKYHVQMHLSTHQKEGLILEENRNDILAMVLQNARKIPKQGDAPTNLADLIPADERSRVCNICGEMFQHFYYLEEHLKSHGSRIAIEDENKEEERKHICQVCNKSFKLHYYLKLHSFTHTKEKPYICQQCGKGFITKGKLKRHLETHSGLKKYQCHICYKFFTRPSYLRIHVRTIHGNQDYNFRVGFREGKEFGLAAPLLPVMTQYSN